MNKIDIREELHQNFIDFSYEANSQRAFPDARDGLKPGQRACLWEMFTKGYVSTKPHVKSAKISGGVIATWWPHGDVAIYETFVRMSQPWINNVPEVDFHGANGNLVIGSAPASSRYTEARLSKVIENGMFGGIKKANVPMILNFSEDEEWPSVLPAVFPRLIVNGSQGIGSTIAQTWLPHNLKEVGDVILAYLADGNLDTSNLYPDFPNGGIIINKDESANIYSTGKGRVILRGKTEIKKDSILITELPYQVYVEPFIESIREFIAKDDATLKHIKDIKNKSDRKRMLIEIECEKDTASKVLAYLFLNTDLQKNYNANQNALVNDNPEMLTLKQYIDIYVKHNIECIVKEAEFDLAKAASRLIIVLGLLKALEDIDNIIALIKSSSSAAVAKENLIKKYEFTEEQAKAIVDMKLGKLANLETIELNKEKNELVEFTNNLKSLLNSNEKQKNVLIEKLTTFVNKYGTPRKTELSQVTIEKMEKEIAAVVPEDVVVVLTNAGDIKRIPKSSFKTQKRGGKGVKSENDTILSTISTNTIDTLLLFSNLGKMYRVIVDKLPIGTNVSKGMHVSTLINIEPQEKIIAITSLERKNNKQNVVFITTQGLIKKTLLEEYVKTKKTTGMVAIKIKENDSIANIELMNEETMVVATKNGMSIHFETKDIAATGRNTSGVKAIKLADGDEVLKGVVVDSQDKKLVTATSKGFAKKVELKELTLQGRAGKGIAIHKETDNSGKLIGVALVADEDSLLLVGTSSSICVSASDIPTSSRITIGNTMIKNGNLKTIVKI